MMYWQFLAAVTVPALTVLGALTLRQPIGDQARWRIGLGTVLVLVPAAVLITAPWDNYVIAHGIRTPSPERVLATLYRIPVEGYAFMVLQTLATGLWTLYLLRRETSLTPPADDRAGSHTRRVAGAGWLTVIAVVLTFEESERMTYLIAITVWFVPLLLVQGVFGADILQARRNIRLFAVAVPTVLLWCADRFAIAQQLWIIDPQLTLAMRPLGLPLEEAIFLLITNLLVANAVLLTTEPLLLRRLRVNKNLATAEIG